MSQTSQNSNKREKITDQKQSVKESQSKETNQAQPLKQILTYSRKKEKKAMLAEMEVGRNGSEVLSVKSPFEEGENHRRERDKSERVKLMSGDKGKALTHMNCEMIQIKGIDGGHVAGSPPLPIVGYSSYHTQKRDKSKAQDGDTCSKINLHMLKRVSWEE